MTPKVFMYIAMGFLGIAGLSHAYQDVLPDYTKWFVDTAAAATYLASLFTNPPWEK